MQTEKKMIIAPNSSEGIKKLKKQVQPKWLITHFNIYKESNIIVIVIEKIDKENPIIIPMKKKIKIKSY